MFSLTVDAPDVGAARLRLSGHFDDAAAREVLFAAATAVRCGCSRLVVDLDGIESYDEEAAFAVVGCTGLARWLPDGVAVVTGPGAGTALADCAGIAPHCAEPHAAGTMVSCPAC